MTPYQKFCERWKNGCGSEMCAKARKVFGRGTLPCDVLFVGEAPGKSENVLGEPFVGPAGHLMDQIIARALETWAGSVTYALTNVVCCIPRDPDGGKAGEPDDNQIACCTDRLRQFVEIARPKLVVCVGALARDTLDPKYKDSLKLPGISRVDVEHPASILRKPVAAQGLSVQRAVVVIRNAVEEFATPAGG